MNNAEQFVKEYTGKLIFNIGNYVWSGGPDIWASAEVKRDALVQYEVKFNDGSCVRVIMTSAQYYGLRRSRIYDTIKTIGGEGHRKFKAVLKNGFEIHLDTIRQYEPFYQTEIRGIKVVKGNCEWVDLTDPELQFVSVYAKSDAKDRFYCIADCSTLEQAEAFAETCNVFARFTLDHTTHEKI